MFNLFSKKNSENVALRKDLFEELLSRQKSDEISEQKIIFGFMLFDSSNDISQQRNFLSKMVNEKFLLSHTSNLHAFYVNSAGNWKSEEDIVSFFNACENRSFVKIIWANEFVSFGNFGDTLSFMFSFRTKLFELLITELFQMNFGEIKKYCGATLPRPNVQSEKSPQKLP